MENNGTDIPIQLYLSYPSGNQDAVAARDKLQAVCAENQIKLVFDKEATRDGDSLIAFMDDLVSSRFTVLFLSPDYFKSAWCMYELIRLHENGFKGQPTHGFAFRLSPEIDLKYKQQVKKYWNGPDREDDLSFLADRLEFGTAVANLQSTVWEKIEEAWDSSIHYSLEKKDDWLDPDKQEEIFRSRISQFKQTTTREIEQEHQGLRDGLKKELEINLQPQALESGLAADFNVQEKSELASRMLGTEEVADAIAAVTRVVSNLSSSPLLTEKEWESCHFYGDRVCALLLLNSVDKNWWFQNKQRFLKECGAEITQTYVFEEKGYSEVIICRGLTRPSKEIVSPRFDFNGKTRDVAPSCELHDAFLFDAGIASVDDTLLHQIFQDVVKREPTEKEREVKDSDEFPTLIRLIRTRAVAKSKQKKGPLYYLVSPEFMKDLEQQKWYEKAREQWAGSLMFVVCETNPPPNHQAPTTEDQSVLLSTLADYKALAYDRRKNNNANA